MTTLPELRSSAKDSFVYSGDRTGWHVALSVHRDSDALDRSNWEVITKDVLAVPDDPPCITCDNPLCSMSEPIIPDEDGYGGLVCPSCQTSVEFPDDLADAAIERVSHFLVGWIDYLIVRPGSSAERKALEWCERLENYPIADEEHFYALESDEEWCVRCDRGTREEHGNPKSGTCGKFRSEDDAEDIRDRWQHRS